MTRAQEIAKIARNQLSHDVDLPRVKIRDQLVKFDFLQDSYAERDIHEIPVNPKILEETLEGYSYLPECERTYVRGREWSIEMH